MATQSTTTDGDMHLAIADLEQSRMRNLLFGGLRNLNSLTPVTLVPVTLCSTKTMMRYPWSASGFEHGELEIVTRSPGHLFSYRI